MEMTPAQKKLVTDHIAVAEAQAVKVWRTAQHALELDELKSLAYMGLVMAAVRWETYCAERGYDPAALQYFVPYVQRRSRGAVMDAIRSADWANRSLRARYKLLENAGLHQGASEAVLASRSGLTIAEVRSTKLGMSRRPVSLDQMVEWRSSSHEKDRGSPEALVLDSVESAESSARARELLNVTVQAFQELDELSQTVLALRYFSGIEIKEVAVRTGLTESRASHIHTDAVLKIHAALKTTALGERMQDVVDGGASEAG